MYLFLRVVQEALLLSSAGKFIPSVFERDSWNAFAREIPDSRKEIMIVASSVKDSDSPYSDTVNWGILKITS